MKPIIVLAFLILFSGNVTPQNSNGNNALPKINSGNNPLFGDNIIINNVPGQDQNNIAICSAFNGWLYATYWYSNNTVPYLVLLKSIDKGKTWVKVYDDANGVNNHIMTKLTIVACGQDTSNLKVFIGGCVKYTIDGRCGGCIGRFNGVSGTLEDAIFNDLSSSVRDLAIAGDNIYPAINSNPFSIAVVYSKQVGNYDSVIVYTSNNGGMYLNSHYNLAASGNYISNVSISYGRSPSYPNGRYFISWEEKQNANSPCGHIYTSHSEPNFNSAFTAPIQLDNLNPSTTNKLNNPAISCQVNAADNDQANLTELVICEKYISTNNRSDLVGFNNKSAVTTSDFQYLAIDTSTNNKVQPDLCFNSFDSTFMLTYYDSTDIRLPFLTNNFNLSNPSLWNIVSNKYNTDDNLSAPHPKVILDFAEQSAAFTWIADQSGGKGAAMFDAQFNFPVGSQENEYNENLLITRIYPNPATTYLETEFYLKEKENVTASIITTLGQCVDVPVNLSYPEGLNKTKITISNFSQGVYLLNIRAERFCQTKRFQVLK